MKVTTDDLLDAIREALTKPEGGDWPTANELADGTGISLARVRKSLRKVANEGRLEVRQVYRPDISGRQVMVPAYRFKGGK